MMPAYNDKTSTCIKLSSVWFLNYFPEPHDAMCSMFQKILQGLQRNEYASPEVFLHTEKLFYEMFFVHHISLVS